jgi:outer membrane protein insertion porin family
MGGYSTADGFLGQVSVSERNLFGTGRFGKVSVTYGQYTRGAELNFVEPYFLDQRMSAGIDLFARQTLQSPYLSYGTEALGTTLNFGIPLREDLSLQLRYSAYWQAFTLPSTLDDCNNIDPNFKTTFPTPPAVDVAPPGAYPGLAAAQAAGVQSQCIQDLNGTIFSQASLAVRSELAQGGYLTSLVGYGLTYNTLDNNKHPTSGLIVSFGQDFAGVGGDSFFIRSVVDFRSYYEIVSDLVSVLHLQAGDMLGLEKCPVANTCVSNDGYVRMLDDFKMGPNLVRGFEPAGFGPRDITPGATGDALGGTMYWGASYEVQYPFFFLPKDVGMRGAVFLDSGAVWGYRGETQNPATGEVNGTVTTSTGVSFPCQCGMQYADTPAPRVSVGASVIWDSPFGPLRFDLAYPILKQSYDRVQWFQFGGGTKF